MRLLITRPEPAASALAAELAGLGHTAVSAPLFTIVDLPARLPALAGFDALIFSSANGVAAFARRTPERDIEVRAVGPQTAAAARAAGFADVHTGPGTGTELLATLPDRWNCLHITAPEGKRLTAEGLCIERVALYTSEPVAVLPVTAAAALGSGALDGALFFSPRSAKVFSELTTAAGLKTATARLTAYCISESTAEALSTRWKTIEIAAAPHRAALIDLL